MLHTSNVNNMSRRRRQGCPSLQSYRIGFVLILCIAVISPCSAFSLFSSPRLKSNPSVVQVLPLATEEDQRSSSSSSSSSSSEEEQNMTAAPLLDWNASGSIGSLLMQMQKKEEEMRKLNKTLLDKEQALDLSSGATEKKEKKDEEEELASSSSEKSSSGIPRMTFATAKELDESVFSRISTSVGEDAQLLELPTLYQVLQSTANVTTATTTTTTTTTSATTTKDDTMPLSKPDHYEERIGRDMRHLAVSIASCIDDPTEWRLFCVQMQPTGALMPLVDCIREGAKEIRKRQQETEEDEPFIIVEEERFLAASSACRALRNLCALSLDLAAVITDGLLRANAAYQGELMNDLCTLLKYADDNDAAPAPRRQMGPFSRRRRNKKSRPRRNRREGRLQCKLYIIQLLLAMTSTSDSAVDALRKTEGLREEIMKCSSYARKEQTRRWLRYPGEMIKSGWRRYRRQKGRGMMEQHRRPFIEATALTNDLNGRVQGASNQVLAAMGYNQWVPKIPGQKGLRILCLDGGGSRGMTSVSVLDSLVKSLGGVEVADCFDMVVGTSTGAIIAFLVGLRRETSELAVQRYDVLIEKIFTKSAMSTPLLLFTTASYDEAPFMNILSDILGDYTMLDSRADPAVPFVFGVTSKMSSTPTHVALFRNYNYNGGELPDPFTIRPEEARESLGLTLDLEDEKIRKNDYPRKVGDAKASPGVKRKDDGSRHPGSFRVLQRYALRASTAAPTVFKPVLMGGEMYCDGGIVASNPTHIGIHEARNLFPDIPIELVVSIGTGGFLEQKSAPRIGWDGIIGQIVGSATDGEQIHHILEDILGEGSTAQLGRSSVSNTRYMRFNPIVGLPDDFPIDVTDPEKLLLLKKIAREYMNEPAQKRKLQDLADLLQGRPGFFKMLKRETKVDK